MNHQTREATPAPGRPASQRPSGVDGVAGAPPRRVEDSGDGGDARRAEAGFTLVELLVVVAVLAILVGIVTVSFTGVLGGSQTTAAAAELNIVQTSVDVKMANESLTSVTAITTATNDMSSSGFDLYPTYMRNSTTKGTYTVTSAGVVTQVTTGY